MGAPIAAYNRISDERSSLHSNIYEPDYVVVVDATLLSAVAVTAGLKETGAIVVNTEKEPKDLVDQLEGYKGKVYTIDASAIAGAELGNRSLSNTAMLAAIVKVSECIPEDAFMKEMETSIKETFSSKPHVIEPNMKAIERGLKEVKGL
jgi:pyruvate ferredoxin oxidoreductase gamma subunit